MSTGLHLLLIDPQNDFCDLPGAALPVTGADADLTRVATLVDRLGARLDRIHVTLDSHQPVDIAHPVWWCNADGEAPAPFTLITVGDVESGLWRARDPQQQAHSVDYVRALATRARHALVIWPEHCLIGGWGHQLHAGCATALQAWGRQTLRTVDYVFKGMNPGTEHYSALCAEVPDPADPGTRPDPAWIARLAGADTVLIAGQALSHCVASTVRDLADALGDASRLLLLDDCSSPVAGFEALGREFVDEMVARGMRVERSDRVQRQAA
ncbi:nicotinamidase-related amidase [Microvirgula sp. AG722]|uniref:hypothetical protein n=1 Tax=Microvirgula sp. AG722 TaxID=2183901 RepID=UPI000DC4E644|nr:hypothetical protein [Microvirgula sp. AG722]RAS15777.1 nicotinamidase-related amidase [Microvirgula sp. AG722]